MTRFAMLNSYVSYLDGQEGHSFREDWRGRFGPSLSKLPAFFSGTTFHDSGLTVRAAGTTE